MNQWSHRLRWWLRGRTAIQWITAIAVLISITLAMTYWIVGSDNRALQRQLNAVRNIPIAPAGESMATATYRTLASERESLPRHADINAQLDKLFEAATENNVELERADYKLVTDPVALLDRYQMTIPVKGTAIDIQCFILEAMNASRALALEGVSFRRERTDVLQIEAQISFVLYLQPKPLIVASPGKAISAGMQR